MHIVYASHILSFIVAFSRPRRKQRTEANWVKAKTTTKKFSWVASLVCLFACPWWKLIRALSLSLSFCSLDKEKIFFSSSVGGNSINFFLRLFDVRDKKSLERKLFEWERRKRNNLRDEKGGLKVHSGPLEPFSRVGCISHIFRRRRNSKSGVLFGIEKKKKASSSASWGNF